jgi:hypothetical protein
MTHAPPEADPNAEGSGAFGGFIGRKTLEGLVRNAAPYVFDDSVRKFVVDAPDQGRLVDLANDPLGYLAILRREARRPTLSPNDAPPPAAWTDYFAYCVSAHFATVTTYVPTDVDTKIRDRLWFDARPSDELERQRDFVLRLDGWDVRPVSRRYVDVDGRIVALHDGERLSILCGGMLGLLAAGDVSGAAAFEERIDAELRREAEAFDAARRERGREIDVLILSAILTHNAGDVDQGLSARGGANVGLSAKTAFGRLAHERFERYGGAFHRASILYRACMASEGHRHYPLREARALRKHPTFLLPIGPFFDAWGATVATSPRLETAERAAIVAALVEGVRKTPGQRGYQRALSGFEEAHPGGLDARELQASFPAAVKKALKDATLRREIAVKKASFEASIVKAARAALGD